MATPKKEGVKPASTAATPKPNPTPTPPANEAAGATTPAQIPATQQSAPQQPQGIQTEADPGQKPEGGTFLNPNPQPPEDDRVVVTPRYMRALSAFLALEIGFPDADMTAEQIENETNLLLEQRKAKAEQVEQERANAAALELELSKTKKAELDNKIYIMLVRDTDTGTEEKRFTRLAYEQMGGKKDGWRPKAEEPEEVKRLKK